MSKYKYKVAYGSKDDIIKSIREGKIPPASIILTDDSNELFFYSLDRQLKVYEEKYKFSSKTEAIDWIGKYDCSGQIISVHEDDKCNIYVVGYDNQLRQVQGFNYVSFDKDPTENDIDYDITTYWINSNTQDLFILSGIRDGKATWKTFSSQLSKESITDLIKEVIKDNPTIEPSANCYIHNQTVASNIWTINHNLNKYPPVTIVDSAGNVVVGDITYVNINSITVKFSGMFSGKAYVN